MNTDQRRRLMRLLNIQSASRDQDRMMDFMHDALEDAGMVVRRRDGQLYATKGNTDNPVPVYVAHADTVHRVVKDAWYAVGVQQDAKTGDRLYYAYDPSFKNIDRGVGGDDKCGLFVCMEAAREFDNVGVIITRDEEIGALGASCIRPEDLAHAAVLIQADRRGARDAIRSTFGSVVISSREWQAHVQESITVHGYSWCDSGLFTDVTRLHEDQVAQVSAINLSAGYYNPHMPSEYISEYDLEWALALSIDLGQLSAGKKWKHEHVRRNAYEEWARDEAVSRRASRHRRNRVDEDVWEAAFQETRQRELDEETLIDEDADEALARAFGGVRYTVGGETRWIYPTQQDEEAVWEGLRASASESVECEMPSCDQRSDTLDYETGMWLCDTHIDDFAALDTYLAAKLAKAVKSRKISEPVKVHANMEVD